MVNGNAVNPVCHLVGLRYSAPYYSGPVQRWEQRGCGRLPGRHTHRVERHHQRMGVVWGGDRDVPSAAGVAWVLQ